MGRLTTEYCVEIRVPKKNSDKNKFGTGYTLGPHWVLTAYHVLFGDDVDATKDIKITWWDETAENIKGEKPVPVERKDIVWWHKEHDIALIRCESPYADIPGAWELIDANYPDTRAGCESSGFLSNLDNKNGKQRRKDPTGTLGSFNQEQITVDIDQLSVNCSIEPEKYWQGFSGSAVFVAGKFVAIVRSVNTGENGLTASFISAALDSKGEGPNQPALLDIPGFIEAPGNYYCWKRYRKLVTSILTEETKLFTALKKDFQKNVGKGNSCDMQQKEFADLLYTTCESDVVECFSRVFGLMRNEKDENGITAFDELAHVWLALITAEVCSVNGISAFKDNEMAHPIPIKAMIPVRIDVEGQVANTEKRKPEFNLQGKELCSPFDLTPKQDTGLDKYESLAAVDAVVHHRLKTAPGIDAFFVGDVKKEVENFAIRKGSGISSSELPDNDEDRREFFMGQLKMAQRMRQGSHYVRLSCEDHAQDHSALCELHRWCPGLLLFDVSREYKSERVMNLTTLNLIIFEAKTFLAEKNTTQS